MTLLCGGIVSMVIKAIEKYCRVYLNNRYIICDIEKHIYKIVQLVF